MLKTNLMMPTKDGIRQRHQDEDLMHKHNCAVRKAIPTPIATDLDDVGNDPGIAPISEDSSVDSHSSVVPQNLREVFGATTAMTMMPLLLMREQTWSHPISMELREYSILLTLSKLLGELLVELVGKQKSIHQPYGVVVLMSNWNACQ